VTEHSRGTHSHPALPEEDGPLARLEIVLTEHAAPADRASALADWLRQSLPEAVRAVCNLMPESEPDSREPAGLAAEVRVAGKSRACLRVELPPDLDPARRQSIAAWLALAARFLGLLLEREELQRERVQSFDLVLLGEAMVGAAHALNNSLNAIVLQASLAQLKLPPELREMPTSVRNEALAAANRIKPLLSWRQQREEQREPLDLNDELRAALEDWPGLAGRVTVDVAPDLPPVLAEKSAVCHLARLLLGHAAGKHWRVRTEPAEGGVRLVLDPGPPAGWPVTGPPAEDVEEELVRSAARALLRQLNGTVEPAAAPWAVRFPAAQSPKK
jgi:signal transduction histidine kinase